MVFLQPKKRVADEEVFHLVAAVVEDERAPVLMLSQAGILMLVEEASIVAGEAVGIFGEVSRHPVQNHSDPCLVAAVHKIPELVGISKTARRRVVVHHLVSPGSIEGMLHHGHEFDVCEPHFLHIGDEAVSEFAIAQRAVALLGDPLP